VATQRPPAWYWVISALLFAVALVGIYFLTNGMTRLEYGGTGSTRLILGAALIVASTLVGRLISKRLGIKR
ncbi:MAG: hypothetical protein JWP40_1813, partial [Blastococcus sp.]|jgi:hypothetical protein|nr:hypothetical protein [Blastococcus sp.]